MPEAEARLILAEDLLRLPERARSPLILCYLGGLTRDEAASQLGQTRSRFRRRLAYAQELLVTRLTRRGVTLSAALSLVLCSSASATAVLPPGLVASTAAAVFAGDGVPALSPELPALPHEVTRAMFTNRLQCSFMALIGTGLGSLLATPVAPGGSPPQARTPRGTAGAFGRR